MVEQVPLRELRATEPALVHEAGREVDVLDVLHQVPLLQAGLVAEVAVEVLGALVVGQVLPQVIGVAHLACK